MGASHTLLALTVQAASPGVWSTNRRVVWPIHGHGNSQKLASSSTEHFPAAAHLSAAHTSKLVALGEVYNLRQVAQQTDMCVVCSTRSKLVSAWAHANAVFLAITHLF